jgi:hypothetical protein
LKDAEMMVPRTKIKLDRAVEELDDLVVSYYVHMWEMGLMVECVGGR